MYLLDTNAWIRYLNGRSKAIIQRVSLTDDDEIVLCDIVLAELYYGAYNSRRVHENLENLRILRSVFSSIPFDGNAARIAGQLRAELERLGTPIGPQDLLIASTAIANDLTLVTHNVAEFSRVSG